MIFGFLIPLLFLAIIIVVARKIFSRDSHGAPSTFSIRRLFQYALLFGLLSVSAAGVAGLIGRLFDIGHVIAESRTDLARDISFTIVGFPLYLLVGRWTKKTLSDDPSERRSVAWNLYLSVVSLTALVTSLTAAYAILMWALGEESFRGQQLSRLLAWGLIWIVHWQLIRSTSRDEESRAHYLAGSLIGLGVLAVGLANLISSVTQLLVAQDEKSVLIESSNPSLRAISLIIIGLPVWFQYWLRVAQSLKRELLWFSYVMLVGVAGGFIALVASSSVIVYDSIVWFFGDTVSDIATQHFNDSIGALGSGLVGLSVWWYHAGIVRDADEAERSELRRVYEYIISGISLIAAAAGLMMIMVAVIESVTPGEVVSTTSSTNTLLLAVTLIIVGAPIWWFFWNRIEGHVAVDGHEQSSPTRRIFLLMLFGVSAIASVISVLTGVFLFLDDLLNNKLGLETVRQMRYALAILLANAAISWYHWSIYRHERTISIKRAKREKFVVLVGPQDSTIAESIESEIGGKVQVWDSTSADGIKSGVDGVMDGSIPWDKDAVIKLIASMQSDEIMILNEKKKLRAIAFNRKVH
jgi:hypothetical protein